MSLQTRDLRCDDCDTAMADIQCEFGAYPACPLCGGATKITWEGGQPPSTDVYGVAQFSDATGEWHTSQRDKKRVMRECGYEECGDRVGGARPDHTLKRTSFSFAGQTSRRTVAEG